MPVSKPFRPGRARIAREKIFGDAPGVPLDGNAKARIVAWVEGYNARMKQPSQHRGPITRAFMEILKAMLWGFHNGQSGRCMPSYEAIAERARCNRDTVYEAIKALEAAGIMTWVHRIARIRARELDLFGQWVPRWRTIRTSNAYAFRDPLPCHQGPPPRRGSSKSENPTGTLNQDISLTSAPLFHPDPDTVRAAQERLALIRQQREALLAAPA